MSRLQRFTEDFAAGMRSWSADAHDALGLYALAEALPAQALQRDVASAGQRAAASAPQTEARRQGLPLALRGVSKRFGDREVLHPIDLHIEPGEFVAIVGRSGCGKSTLLRLVAGLDAPSQGRLERGGDAAGGLHAQIRILFQDARLLPWKSVLANVALGLPLQRRGQAQRVLGQVGLAERAGDWPANLSGGQRQRVALARALLHRPQLLLLDEPLGALDALTRIEMQALIEGLWRQLGFTALLVTHDVQEAVALADRVLLIEHGRIALDLRIGLERPRQRGSAAFAELEQRILERVLATPETAAAAPWPSSARPPAPLPGLAAAQPRPGPAWQWAI